MSDGRIPDGPRYPLKTCFHLPWPLWGLHEVIKLKGWLSLFKSPNCLKLLPINPNFQNYVDALLDQDTEVFSFSAANHFMTAVSQSNIQFLDFTRSNQHGICMKACHKKLLIRVIHSILNQNPASFPNLLGLKIRLDHGDWWESETNLWNTFPKFLSHLDLEIVQWPRSNGIRKLSKVASILQRHATTLQTLTFSWCEDGDVAFYTRLNLPHFPQLTTLNFMSSANSSKVGWSMEMLDCVKLREIFSVRMFLIYKIIRFCSTFF